MSHGLSEPLLDLSKGMSGPLFMRNNIREFNNMFRRFQSVMTGKIFSRRSTLTGRHAPCIQQRSIDLSSSENQPLAVYRGCIHHRRLVYFYSTVLNQTLSMSANMYEMFPEESLVGTGAGFCTYQETSSYIANSLSSVTFTFRALAVVLNVPSNVSPVLDDASRRYVSPFLCS